jgi:hypothetical protein
MKQTAQTILNQLGGNKFIAMTGAKNFVGSDSYLMFQLPVNQIKGNKMKITVNADLYTVEVFKIRDVEVKTMASREMVYADQLRSVFTSITGLETSL